MPRTSNAPAAAYMRALNSEQRRAVLHTDGPLLVLAGAGSGKTNTLVHRLVHLIRGQGVEPERIVVVTFTNRAADEMRERARAYAGDDARRATISTFHSLGVRILREHGHHLGLPARFAIYGTADQLAALRGATSEISIGDDSFDLKRVLSRISDWKSRRILPADARREVAAGARAGAGPSTRADEYAVLAADAYPKYEETLRAAGAVDFDDLLLLPVRLLEESEEVRRSLWKRWHYFMIDEYQDTSPVQLELASRLAGQRRNLCVVGDDDQSIYAFRGADVGNILEFERHFPGAAVIALEQNYRSTRRILEAANAVIAGNPHRHPKRLRTENGIGAPIDCYEHEDDALEAETVAKEIGLRRFRQKLAWRDFAVLYRTNTQSLALEEALREKGVPYRVVGGTAFFERKEVADALAYLRALSSPGDEIALRRIINYPARGIGRTTVLRIAELSASSATRFPRLLREIAKGGEAAAEIGAAQAEAIHGFLSTLDRARGRLDAAEAAASRPPDPTGLPPLARWTLDLIREVGLEDALRSDPRNARTADARAANLRDLAGSIARYERRVWAECPFTDHAGNLVLEVSPAPGGPGRGEAASLGAGGWAPPTMADALARLALSDLETEDEERVDDDAVVLMTLHSAKGLEFSQVFLVGLEEGILPHARSLADAAATEADGATRPASDPLSEERRLLYVGITRAKHHLTLSWCRSRRRGGDAIDVLPSRYLEDLPAALLNHKTESAVLTPEESAELKDNFFASMRAMLVEPEEGEE